MGLLSDYAAMSADAKVLATDQAAVTAAQTALAQAQAKVATDNTTVTADDTQFATDLAAAPYDGLALIPDSTQPSGFVIAQSNAASPGFTLTPAVVAT